MLYQSTCEKKLLTNSDLFMANVEALTTENDNNLWFSNLRTVECTLEKINGGFAIYYKGVLIPAGASYTHYGSKKRCEREFTINTCYLRDETACN